MQSILSKQVLEGEALEILFVLTVNISHAINRPYAGMLPLGQFLIIKAKTSAKHHGSYCDLVSAGGIYRRICLIA